MVGLPIHEAEKWFSNRKDSSLKLAPWKLCNRLHRNYHVQLNERLDGFIFSHPSTISSSRNFSLFSGNPCGGIFRLKAFNKARGNCFY